MSGRTGVAVVACGVLCLGLLASAHAFSAEHGVSAWPDVQAAQAPATRPAEPTVALADTPGVEVLRSRCLSCHGADLIAGQRLGEGGWGREIDKMVRWGARVDEGERPALQAYLVRHFGPVPSSAPMPASDATAAAETSVQAGEATFNRACLACHGRDLTEQQRLTPAGWGREVDKMVRWGAQVSDEDKPALVAYLSGLYGVR